MVNIGVTEFVVIVFIVVSLLVLVGLAYLCGHVARNRGHAFAPFFVGGLLFWPLSLVLAFVLQSPVDD